MGINLSHLKESERLDQIKVNDLNDDVMFTIFEFFNFQELLLLSKVCIRWQTIINRLFARQKYLHFTPVIGLPFELFSQTSHHLIDDNKQTLIALNRIDSYKSFVSQVMSRCLNLKSINLVGLDFNDNCSPFRLLIDYCDSDLNHINFSHLHNKLNFKDKRILIESEEMKQFVEKFPNIVHLNGFRSWFRFTHESITQLISGLKKLELISFAKETDYTESHSSDAISGDYFKFINCDIKVIRVTHKILGRKGLYYLSKRVTNLRELRINVIDSIDDLKLICEHFQSLKCFSFGFEISPEEKFSAFRLISSLHNLEDIDIAMSCKSEENEITSDSCLLELMTNMPNMKSIIFFGKITEQSIQFVDRYWPQLQKLIIKSRMGSAISSTIIPNIAKLKNLNYLDLKDSNITDEDMYKMIFASNELRFVNLSGTRITDKTVDFMIEKANSMPNQMFEINVRRTSVEFLNEFKGRLPNNLLTH